MLDIASENCSAPELDASIVATSFLAPEPSLSFRGTIALTSANLSVENMS